MAFDFSTLVTDRTQQDVAYVKQLIDKLVTGTATDAEKAEWNSFTFKGAYNHTDLNRVTAALEDLKLRLEGYGYAVPGYQRIEIPQLVAGGVSRLPEGYTELAWIESTGTQYIDTGFTPNQDTRVVMDAEILKEPGTSMVIYFGCRGGGYFYELYKAGSSSNLTFLYNTTYSEYFTVEYAKRRTVEVNKNTATVDGITKTYAYSAFNVAYSIYLAADNSEGTVKALTAMRIYSCQIYDNGTLVRDYIPCKNNAGVVGLYDLVSATFFGNSGTGSFIAGAIPVNLPDGYTQVACIESTGTQYIDTGFKPNQDTEVVMDVQSVGVNTNDTGQSFFGARTGNTNMFAAYWHRTNVKYYIFYNSGNTTVDSDRLTNRITVTMDKNNLYVGDSVSVSRDYASFNCDYNLFLFATNLSGNADYFGINKVYSCQVYDNGMLVRNYVPCINPDGVVGLYDLVTSAFFGNAGTGNFIAGDVVSLPSDVVSMTNLVADGSFETTGTWVTWSADALVTEQSLFGSKSLKLTGDQLANISVATPIVGHKYYGREYSKTDGEVTIGDGRFEVHGGDGVGLNWVYGWNRGNYPNWIMQSAVHEIEAVNASNYVLRTFKVGGTGTCYVDGILLVDLTASFGAGFEPDKEWCDTYIPFFEGTQSVTLPPRYEWKEYDIPTTGQMVVYLQNVAVIRSILTVMASTPRVPENMVDLMVQEANDIETILLDVYKQINIMATTFIPCGEALCGGDNL